MASCLSFIFCCPHVKCSVIDMTVFTASWSGLSCDHSQLLLYVCSLAFSKLMQDKLGETALITASARGHLETTKLLLHRGASVNFQRKVRVLYRVAGKFGRELKFELADWWSAFTSDKIKSTKICYSHNIIMIIIIHYGDPVATVNQIYKSHNIKFFFKDNFWPTSKFNSCQYFLLYSVYTFDMVIQAQNVVLSLDQLRWPASQPASQPGGWGIFV